MGVYEKLMQVQSELKAPKNQYNSFGKYNYRSCEDILEGVKPLLLKVKATLTISDEIVQVADRIYVKATSTFTDIENGETITNSAYAREANDKKGMDESQVTGATSSYARKYCLNGLLCIDDTKDADTDERANEKKARASKVESKSEKTEQKKSDEQEKSDEQKNAEMVAGVNPLLVPNGTGMTPERLNLLHKEMERTGINEKTLLGFAQAEKFEDMSEATYIAMMNKLGHTKNK